MNIQIGLFKSTSSQFIVCDVNLQEQMRVAVRALQEYKTFIIQSIRHKCIAFKFCYVGYIQFKLFLITIKPIFSPSSRSRSKKPNNVCCKHFFKYLYMNNSSTNVLFLEQLLSKQNSS